jgi:hypothetical protein
MANGIGRRRAFGIAQQSNFATASDNPEYWLPLTEWTPGEEVEKILNTAMIGSIHANNDAHEVMSKASPSFTIKVTEDEFPLLCKAFGTISSSQVTGDDAVYEHVVTFTNDNDKALYTIFVDDPDREDLTFRSFRVDTMNVTFTKGEYITVELSGLSVYPVTASHTATFSNDFKEFTSANCEFQMADEGGSLSTVKFLEAQLNHTFNVSDNEDNFNLGVLEMEQSFNKQSEMEHTAKLLFDDLTEKNEWKDNQAKHLEAKIIDTTRTVSTSTASTNPSITLDYPSAYFTEWSEDGGADDILKQDLTITVVDKIGIADAPVKITAVNAVTGY